jgi:pimeloyl-[acyl-carrier protein] methyl ester esterase
MPWFENETGNRLWYEDHGIGTPIVFIHGWCMSSAVWEFQREGLPDSFRVITLDLRGHGRSPLPMDDFTIKGCAGDVASLLQHLNIYDAIVAGWSLGALIAIETLLLCKERLAGLVLISGTPRFVQADDFPFGLLPNEADGMAIKVRRSLHRALNGFVERMFAAGEIPSDRVHRLLSSVPVPTAHVVLRALEALVEADMRDNLTGISCPTLIMYGDSDSICLPKASEFMAAQILKSHKVEFAGCGHVPFLTQSCKFNEFLEDFRDRMTGGEYRQE